jgi:hypothetical protein
MSSGLADLLACVAAFARALEGAFDPHHSISDENAAILVAETLTGNASPSTAPLKKAQEAVLFHRVLDQFTP